MCVCVDVFVNTIRSKVNIGHDFWLTRMIWIFVRLTGHSPKYVLHGAEIKWSWCNGLEGSGVIVCSFTITLTIYKMLLVVGLLCASVTAVACGRDWWATVVAKMYSLYNLSHPSILRTHICEWGTEEMCPQAKHLDTVDHIYSNAIVMLFFFFFFGRLYQGELWFVNSEALVLSANRKQVGGTVVSVMGLLLSSMHTELFPHAVLKKNEISHFVHWHTFFSVSLLGFSC